MTPTALLAVLAAVAAAIIARVWFGRFSRERAELRRLRTLFSRYVPEQVVIESLHGDCVTAVFDVLVMCRPHASAP